MVVLGGDPMATVMILPGAGHVSLASGILRPVFTRLGVSVDAPGYESPDG